MERTEQYQAEGRAVLVVAAIERTFGADVTAELLTVPRSFRFLVSGYPRVLITWQMLWDQPADAMAWYVAARMGLPYEENNDD